MEYEVTRYDEDDRQYTVTVEVEYSCSPEEYEAGYYFAGGVEYEGAKILDYNTDADEDGEEANVTFTIGQSFELDDSEIDDVCSQIRSSVASDNGGRYPRMNISPDW